MTQHEIIIGNKSQFKSEEFTSKYMDVLQDHDVSTVVSSVETHTNIKSFSIDTADMKCLIKLPDFDLNSEILSDFESEDGDDILDQFANSSSDIEETEEKITIINISRKNSMFYKNL